MQQPSKKYIPTLAAAVSMLIVSLVAGGCSLSNRAGGHQDVSVLEEVVANLPLNQQVARLPGATMIENGEIRLRRASAPPLVIIDGTPMGVGNGDLSFLNPAEVARVEVVTGPKTAVYGQRGAYGVLKITTKHEASITSRKS